MVVHDIETLTQLLHTDQADVLGMTERGALPSPMIIDGRLVRWAGDTIDAWLTAGCPSTNPPRNTFFQRVRLEWHAERLDRSLRAAMALDEAAGSDTEEE
jgi:predicted DNA-binding transcriptional regulator AlpA